MAVPIIALTGLSAQAVGQLDEAQASGWFMISQAGYDTVHLTRTGAEAVA